MKTKEIQAVIGLGLLVGIIIVGITLVHQNKKKDLIIEPKHD